MYVSDDSGELIFNTLLLPSTLISLTSPVDSIIPGDGGVLMGIYVSSGFLKIIGVIEIIGGLLLLMGKFVRLALTFLLAIMFNAVIFHVLHDMANIPGALVGLILGLVLVVAYKDRFSSLLSA